MFPPAQRPLLEVEEQWVNLWAPDADRFPGFHAATPFETVLQPGQAVYIPRGWPHMVESLDDTVSITVRGDAGCKCSVRLLPVGNAPAACNFAVASGPALCLFS